MSQQETRPHPVLLESASQTSHVQVSLLTSKFAKPLKVIGLIDTGAAKTMIKPDLLPPEEWMPSRNRFQATNGESFGANSFPRKRLELNFFLTASYGNMCTAVNSREKTLSSAGIVIVQLRNSVLFPMVFTIMDFSNLFLN
jgi:hypothetical protein